MKITLLTDGIYPYVMGGMQKHSYYLAKYLAKNKVEVNLYHCVPNDKPLVEHLEGFTNEELKYINHHCFHFPKLDSFPGHYIRENKKLSELYLQHFNRNKTHHSLHIARHNIYAQGFTGRAFITAKKQGIELPDIYVNFHGLNMFQKAPSFRVKLEHLLLRKAMKYNVANANYAISLGGKLTDILKKIGVNKIIEQGIGIERNWLRNINEIFNSNKQEIRFVFIGRYERGKGIEELNEVLKELNSESSIVFHVDFIGPIPDTKWLKVQSSKLKAHYYGSITNESKIKEILHNSDVLISPSWSEGMPTVILEAMASGCAIIATNVGAVAEQVDKTNGWLIEAGNKNQLKKSILSAINISDKKLLEMKKASVKKISKKFLWDDVIKSTIEKLKG